MPASATSFPFETRAAAMAGDPAKSARFLSLDGLWKFRAIAIVRCGACRVRGNRPTTCRWVDIKVPADWQAGGHDQARYFDITLSVSANRPLIPRPIPVGSYRRDVTPPAGWTGQDVILHIGAAGSAATTCG